MDLTFNTTPKSQAAGTAPKPRPVSPSIGIAQTTRSGTGQAATSKALNITLPKELRFLGRSWAEKLRCDPIEANQVKSNSACPKARRSARAT